MICPKCKSKSKVYNSRPTDDGTIRRNRECLKCSHRYATIEVSADIKKVVDIEKQVVAKPVQKQVVAKRRQKKKKWRNANMRSYSSYDIDAMTDDELLEALDRGWVNPADLD